ncbi:hypothetical protein POJ06DRAFT_191317 [Lipomyces tetrasporus]|uniref:J domain-containing protein n=1 Tax=Lipomyces tetrasporus TaxID=54092 RepID=A0AAD7VVW4_9ASCO|nr:uncharacterized protein POJ06DRAFT_191317 [Lipomyces tetrasporus]KAJ8103481.1 hypothetical protein POJ06DRAFT_191317 [Lipomyces tetrasporus]
MTDDIDALLSRESAQLTRDVEIARIQATHPLDAYAVLELLPGCGGSDVRAQYRRKSLLIHPDKTANPDAPVAFDRLKKAQDELLDDKKRGVLDTVFADARRVVMRDKGWTVDHPEVDGDAFVKEWRVMVGTMLEEDKGRRERLLKAQMQAEGRERERAEREVEDRKRKREMDKKWEDTRDERISNWRDFKKGGGKKKKAKANVLG